jgi:HAD superfamily hydrolase (TIGR01509 family)
MNTDAAGLNLNRESESIAKKYKHIIFDFGGVFLDLEGKRTGVPRALARIFDITEDEASEVWEDSKEKLLTGQETPKEFLAVTAKKLDVSIDLENSHNEWRSFDMAGKEQRIDWKLLEYAERLKKHYAIHLLTNMIDLDQESSGWVREFDSHFENVFKSYEEKLRKPDREAFLNVLRKINAKPEECVLVDDSLTNIRVAEELGLKCVRFTTLEALNDEFKKLGVV